MPSTIVTTVGAANANSYVDVAAADLYFGDKLDAAVWTAAITDDKTRALLMAAERLQNENWHGNRVTTTQRLAWPRLYVQKVDGIGMGYGWGYGYYSSMFGDIYLSTEIPQPVKDAQCELALALLGGFTESGEAAIESFTADGVSVKFKAQPAGEFPARVSQLLAGLTIGNVLVRG